MHKRWRNKKRLAFVRSLRCRCRDPRCPPCSGTGSDRIVAAHLRSMSGAGIKPHDFVTYPLSQTIHTLFHNHGQNAVSWQLARVEEVWAEAFDRGVLLFDSSVDFEEVPF